MSKLNELLMAEVFRTYQGATEQEINLRELREKYTEFVEGVKKAGIKIELCDKYHQPRINLLCNDKNKKTCEQFMNKLRITPEVEAMLILKAAITDLDLRGVIEERAAIRQFDAGLSGSVFLSVMNNIAPQRLKDGTMKELEGVANFDDEIRLLGIM